MKKIIQPSSLRGFSLRKIAGVLKTMKIGVTLDIGGLLALALSVLNLYLLLAPDPDVVTLPPEQVLIQAAEYAGRSTRYVRFAAIRTYVNKNRFGGSALLQSEAIAATVGDRRIEQRWQSFENFQVAGLRLQSTSSRGTHPMAIGANAAVDHETYYAPHPPTVNFVEWRVFLDLLHEVGEVEFRFIAEFYDDDPLIVTCSVQTTEQLIRDLGERGWAAPPCSPKAADRR